MPGTVEVGESYESRIMYNMGEIKVKMMNTSELAIL